MVIFFFKQKTAYEMRISDWSSDVCSSDLNTGTSWRVHYYFRVVRDLKARHGICYIPFVHDLIPIVAAQYCAPGITEDFASWLIGAVRHADGFLVNRSEEHTSELQSLMRISYAVVCLNKTKRTAPRISRHNTNKFTNICHINNDYNTRKLQ